MGLGRDLRNDTLMQIHQARLSIDLEGGGAAQPASGAEPQEGAELLERALRTWQTHARPVHNQRESHYERQVANTLVGLGLFHVRVSVAALTLLSCRTIRHENGLPQLKQRCHTSLPAC